MFEIIPNWHPIFVHFTVALLSLAVGLYFITHFMKSSLRVEWRIVARWSLWFGAVLTILTGFTGLYAYNSVDHDTPSHLAMTDHRNWAVVTITLFLILAIWSLIWFRKNRPLGTAFILSMLVAGGVLASTAWHGGEVVYRYGLGVMSLPKAEGDGHDHSHGSSHEHGNSADHSNDEDRHSESEHQDVLNDKAMDFSGMEETMNEEGHDHDHAH